MQITDAIANQITPTTNTRRRPSRSPSEPLSRISAASGNMYALTIHCRPATSASNSSPIAGSATFTTVPSRNAIPDPRAVAASTHLARLVPNAIRSSVMDSQ